MKITTKQIAMTGILLAMAILSQFVKNTSVYITGSVINLILIITTIYCGPICGCIISVITPITSFFITGAVIIAAVPAILPAIILGNILYVLVYYYLVITIKKRKQPKNASGIFMISGISACAAACVKAAVMGVLIVKVILVYLGGSLPEKALAVARVQFSLTQLITAVIGGLLASIIAGRISGKSKDLKDNSSTGKME